MKRYTVSQARERLAEVLDEAEQTGSVVIERRNVHYVIAVERKRRPHRDSAPAVEILDPAVESGSWTWTAAGQGLRFRPRRTRTRR
jgi:prevent-host-death family protein